MLSRFLKAFSHQGQSLFKLHFNYLTTSNTYFVGNFVAGYCTVENKISRPGLTQMAPDDFPNVIKQWVI